MLIPQGNHIHVQVLPLPEKHGRLYLPLDRKTDSWHAGELYEALVVSVGPRVDPSIKAGVRLLLDPYFKAKGAQISRDEWVIEALDLDPKVANDVTGNPGYILCQVG